MTRLIFILSISAYSSSFGQIVNSLSGDTTGMYFYAVDSAIQIVKTMKTVERVVLRANLSDISKFPDTIRGVQIVKQEGFGDFSVKGVRENDIVFRIAGLSIIRDQVTLSIGTYQRVGKVLKFFGDVIYVFYFKYVPDTQTYRLSKIKKGMVL